MKKFILFLITFIILTASITVAQEGRPQYKIRNERAGEYIGDIIIELFPYVAPLHVANFDSLVSINFYDSTAWHRVVPDFVIQGGDPNSKDQPRDTWGYGDSTQATVPAEFSKVSHLRGIIGAARDVDTNSATSQFYINTFDNTGLDGNYTAYGIVVEGMDVVDDIESSPRDENDNPLEKIEMFITKIGVNESVPGTPEILEPVDGQERFTIDTALVWTPVEDAVLYFLEVARDSNFTDIFYADSFEVKPGNISIKLRNIELGLKTFYWRVRSNNGAKFSDYSDVRSFTTAIAPPVLVYPESEADGIDVNPVLQWEPVEGVISYHIQLVRYFANFDERRLIVDEAGITETEFHVEGLSSNTVYYWRVLSETEEYDSPYSEAWAFTTGDVTGVEDESQPTEFMLTQNYPNPFNPATVIGFQLAAGSKVYLKVYDVLGRELLTLINKELQPGKYEVEFDAAQLPSGVYYYKLSAGEYTETKKMVLIK